MGQVDGRQSPVALLVRFTKSICIVVQLIRSTNTDSIGMTAYLHQKEKMINYPVRHQAAQHILIFSSDTSMLLYLRFLLCRDLTKVVLQTWPYTGNYVHVHENKHI